MADMLYIICNMKIYFANHNQLLNAIYDNIYVALLVLYDQIDDYDWDENTFHIFNDLIWFDWHNFI